MEAKKRSGTEEDKAKARDAKKKPHRRDAKKKNAKTQQVRKGNEKVSRKERGRSHPTALKPNRCCVQNGSSSSLFSAFQGSDSFVQPNGCRVPPPEKFCGASIGTDTSILCQQLGKNLVYCLTEPVCLFKTQSVRLTLCKITRNHKTQLQANKRWSVSTEP